MDSSRPSYLIEVVQPIKHFAVYAGNTIIKPHTKNTYMGIAV